MASDLLLLLASGGLFSGILAGFLGIGGGTVLVPILVAMGYSPVQAVATSGFAIAITSISGSIQNWRMGYLDFKRVLALGLPAVITAQAGAWLASSIPAWLLLFTFALLLWLNIYLVDLRRRLNDSDPDASLDDLGINSDIGTSDQTIWHPTLARLLTGGAAGLLAGLFGVGGGVIMVPLQVLLLAEPLKLAIQTSLGVIIITAISATFGHAIAGNVLFGQGLVLGLGGLVGAQVSTRFLPRLSDQVISLTFRGFLGILSIYILWQAWTKLMVK
jgi:uncharacterized membrane protein YfcA